MKIRSSILLLGLVSFIASSAAQSNSRVPTNFSLQINGQIRYAVGRQPAQNVLVRLEAFSGGLIGQILTDRTGKFGFSGLVAQQYILTVHAPGFIDVRQTVDLLTQNTGYFNIDLIADRDAVGGPVQPVVGIVNAAVPDEAQAAYERGRALLNSHDPASAQAAIRELEHAVSIYPGYLEARIALGIAYMDQRSWEKAEKSLRAAVALNGQASTAQFALAEVYLNEKKYAEGIVSASEGLKANPQSAPGHFTLARLYWAMGPKALDEKDFRTKVESAWAEVSRAISIDPKLAEAHLLAGNMLLKAKRPADALKHFETYLKLEPDGDLAAETTEIADKIRKALKQQQ